MQHLEDNGGGRACNFFLYMRSYDSERLNRRRNDLLNLRRQGASMQSVNYGPEAEEIEQLKPQPNPQTQQLNQEQRSAPPKAKEEGAHPKTIGDALEEASKKAHDKPLKLKDARAIQSAEARATGAPSGVLGGPASYASNLLNAPGQPTLGDALADAKQYLPADKVVTQRNAERIMQAESRNDPMGRADPQGVASTVQEAAAYNVEHGFVPSEGVAGRGRGRGSA